MAKSPIARLAKIELVSAVATIAEDRRATSHWPFSVMAPTIGQGASDFVASDFESFRRQEFLFSSLNLLLIGSLFILEFISRLVRNKPPLVVLWVLAAGVAAQSIHVAWMSWRTAPLSAAKRELVTLWSLGFNSGLAFALTCITIKSDSAYYALMLLPVLEAAFRLSLGATIAMVIVADFITFLGAYGLRFGEYIEAGAMSVIYTVMGILVWLLINNLREREARFVNNLAELERTRERLLSEEKLATVGRLSRSIAHEIRNPVAMIASSLATAARQGQDEAVRQEMFAIAAKEAARLEQLTTDFLVYARPRPVQIGRANVADMLNYVASVARAHAANKGVAIEVSAERELEGYFDAGQMQQALLNLVQNAIDACGGGDRVNLNAERNDGSAIRIDVIDPAGPISNETVEHIFEPLFTTKQGGNGLGLAIARNIVRAHGGDIVLKSNQPGRVCFSIAIPARSLN
ncbi:MAG TPA: HAMP domain-containing sensor histidine kinase [Candidatus Binataceae bacterium]|nr:HAMP domain-containing sensor histidine kinase [Candidatus Binataceae bacterium]